MIFFMHTGLLFQTISESQCDKIKPNQAFFTGKIKIKSDFQFWISELTAPCVNFVVLKTKINILLQHMAQEGFFSRPMFPLHLCGDR